MVVLDVLDGLLRSKPPQSNYREAVEEAQAFRLRDLKPVGQQTRMHALQGKQTKLRLLRSRSEQPPSSVRQ